MGVEDLFPCANEGSEEATLVEPDFSPVHIVLFAVNQSVRAQLEVGHGQ
jgi:hypothetical protein